MPLLFWCGWPALAPFPDGVVDARRGYLGLMIQPLDDGAIEARRAEAARLKEPAKSATERRIDALRPGLLIAGLYKDGPAQRVGLKEDDVIISVAGVTPEAGLRELQAAMRRSEIGKEVAVRCLRIDGDGKAREVAASIVPISRDAMMKLEPPAAVRRPFGGRPVMLVDFEKQAVNVAPAGWTSGRLGGGAAGGWRVLEEAGAPSGKYVLGVVEPGGSGAAWDLCVSETPRFPDDCISHVRLKSADGPGAAGGGIVFGYQDDRNFYAAVLDFKTREAVLYKVVDGHAMVLTKRDKNEAARVGVAIEPGKWHKLQAERQTTRLLVRVDGSERALLDARDATFTGGRAGVLVPAGAATRFDDFAAEEPIRPVGR